MSGSTMLGRKGRVLAAAVTYALAQHASAQFLAVDLNGGDAISGNNNSTNLGWDGTTNQPVNGVTWTPWGGRVSQGGDGTNLPFNPGSPVVSITKSFTTGSVTSGAVSVTLAAGGSGQGLNSRDRGGPPTGTTNNADMYRDLVFATRNTNLQLGGSPMVITFSGLNKNTTYEFTTYAFDQFNSGQYLFGEVNTVPYDYAPPTEQVDAMGEFANPPNPVDGSIIGPRVSAPAGGVATASSGDQFASRFRLTTDNTGSATIYEWSNSSFSSGFQTAAILNGFTIGTPAQSTWTATSSTTYGNGFTGSVPDGDHAIANFGSTAAPQTVTIEGAGRTLGSLDIVSPNAYTFSGGTLTMQDSFPVDPNVGPPPSSPPSLTSSTTGHAAINVNGDGTFNVTHVIASPVVLAQQTSVTTGQSQINLRMTGPISGTKGLNKLGSGALILTGSNTYGGATNVYAGSLLVDGRHDGGADYTLGGGATLGGSGTITLRDDIQAPNTGAPAPGKVAAWNASAIAPGDGGVGTLTIDRLAIGSPTPHGSGSVSLNIDIGSGSADKLLVTDTNGVGFANASGTLLINVSALSGAAAGMFPILDYTGSLVDSSGNPLPDLTRFALASTTVGGFSLALVNDTQNTSVDLAVVAGTIGPSTWTGATNANWSISGNWSGLVPNAVDATAVFGTNAANQYAVNVDGPKTVGTMSFSGGNSYTLSGSTITFQAANGAPAIVTGSGNHTIAAPVTLNNFLFITTTTGASLTMSGTITATASGQEISVSGGGTTSFAQLTVGTLLVNAGTTKISSKASVGNPAGTTHIGTLSVTTGATFDLTNNFAILDNTPIATVQGQIATAYANGAWTGAGITSSSAAAVAANSGNSHKMAVGYAVASDVNNFSSNPGFTFGGLTPSSTSVLIAYTLAGDANLDGVVNTSDFTAMATNFGGTAKNWVQGDFNYDGKVNALDFNAIAMNFGATPTPGAVLGGVLVPEPSAFFLLAPLLGLRRKRKGSVYVSSK